MSSESDAVQEGQKADAPVVGIAEAVKLLGAVNESAPESKQYAVSIADKNGGRIKLDDKSKDNPKVIRGVEKLPNTIQGVEG